MRGSSFANVIVDLETPFTRLVGCRAPIQLAVMGGGTGTPELAAAVSEAGGLGMLSSTFPLPVGDQLGWVQAAHGSPRRCRDSLPSTSCRGPRSSNSPPGAPAWWMCSGVILTPRWWSASIPAARSAFWQVGSLDEALAAVDAGCDAVIAQGIEAGGHVRGTTPLATLLRQVIRGRRGARVAAGGIATGAALAEALNAGAAAARVGTRFLATVESGAHREYVAALLNASADDTVCTTVFDQGWPDAPHRVLRVAVDRAGACADQVIGRAAYADRTWEVVRRSSQPPTVFISGEVSAMAMYAGSGVGDITDVPTAAIVLERMTAEALPLLSAPPR